MVHFKFYGSTDDPRKIKLRIKKWFRLMGYDPSYIVKIYISSGTRHKHRSWSIYVDVLLDSPIWEDCQKIMDYWKDNITKQHTLHII